MTTRNAAPQLPDSSTSDGAVKYEAPWKLLAFFAVMFAACIVYGFVS